MAFFAFFTWLSLRFSNTQCAGFILQEMQTNELVLTMLHFFFYIFLGLGLCVFLFICFKKTVVVFFRRYDASYRPALDGIAALARKWGSEPIAAAGSDPKLVAGGAKPGVAESAEARDSRAVAALRQVNEQQPRAPALAEPLPQRR